MNRIKGTPGPKPILEEVGPYIFRERHYKVHECMCTQTKNITLQSSLKPFASIIITHIMGWRLVEGCASKVETQFERTYNLT